MRVNTLILKMAIEQQMSTMKIETKSLREEVVSLRGIIMKQNFTIMNLLQDQRNVMASLRANNSESSSNCKYRRAFPIDSQTQLDHFEAQLNSENMEGYIRAIRKLLQPEGLRKNLNEILSRRMVMEVHMRGTQHHRSLLDYRKFMEALFRASCSEGVSYRHFLEELRISLKMSKNRMHKLAFDHNRRHKKQTGTSEQQSDATVKYEDAYFE